jgi:hypothetical protein
MRVRTWLLSTAVVMAIEMIGASSPASAQGCILLRQTSPLFGTAGSPDQAPGTWNVTFTGRSSTADIHYNGTVRQVQREREQTYVVNRQNSMTATLSYQWTRRVSVHAGIPWFEASWGIPSPRTGGPAARANENARGLGDITAFTRVSLVDPAQHSWNLQVGGGVKLPTGRHTAVDTFPDGNGNMNVPRYVDISVNPGDGGWGLIFDLQGYKALGRFMVFGSGTWLANPRDTGGPSRGNLVGNPTPSNVNTVSDQFVFRAGTTVSIFRQVSASIAWRMEGVPRYDMFGASHGFRRPGVEMYWEPGITVATGRHAVSFNLPVGYYFNRFRNPYTGNPGDSTFPEYVAIATYSMRLGRMPARHPIMTAPAPEGAAAQPKQQEKKGPAQDQKSGGGTGGQ